MSFQAMNWAMEVNRSGLLKSNEAFVLLVLANYADEEWSCFPSQEQLANDTAQGKRTLVRQVKRLQELGLVTSENRYGKGRGRIGNRYFLIKQAFGELLENREDTRSAKLAPESQNRMNTRSANMAPKSENGDMERSASLAPESQNRMNTRSANMAPERLKCHSRHDSSAIYDISPQVPLKERARINHQMNHQSSDARDATVIGATVTDDDDQQKNYRGVNIERLFDEVPSLDGYRHEPVLVSAAVDVVLDRARGRVGQPTAYVRKALIDDLYGVMAAAMQAGPASAPAMANQPVQRGDGRSGLGEPVPPAVNPTADVDVTQNDAKWDVPDVSELSDDAVPCTNMDHLQNYDMPAHRLSHCNWCRIEQRQGADEYPHVADATDAQVAALPVRLQQWVQQFRTVGSVAEHGS